ncbi:hypothetical protein ACLOJK_003483 [Asimina triloba]
MYYEPAILFVVVLSYRLKETGSEDDPKTRKKRERMESKKEKTLPTRHKYNKSVGARLTGSHEVDNGDGPHLAVFDKKFGGSINSPSECGGRETLGEDGEGKGDAKVKETRFGGGIGQICIRGRETLRA